MLAIELPTMALTTIWFAAGAVVAMFLTEAGYVVQVIVFFAVSVLLLVLVRPWAKKHFNNSRTRTNAESLIGKQAVVIEPVDSMKGRVSVDGMEWSARSKEVIPEGKIVTIQEISGVKLIVEED